MRVWIDVTNSPHVPFFRPLVALLRERGARGADQRPRVRPDGRAPRQRRHRHDVVGPPHAGASRVAQGGCDGRPAARPAPATRGTGASTSPSSHALARAPARRPLARDPVVVRLRLRVRARPARARLPRRDARRRPARDPAALARPHRRAGTQGRRYEGLKEEYYLDGSEPDPPCSATPRARSRAHPRRRRGPRPNVSLYHRHGSPLFADVIERLGSDDDASRPSSCRARRSSAPRSRGRRSRRSSSPTAPSTRRAWSRSPTSSSRRVGR